MGPIFLSQLNCNGSESSLVDCPLPSFGLFSLFCNHANDAGVICRGEEGWDRKGREGRMGGGGGGGGWRQGGGGEEDARESGAGGWKGRVREEWGCSKLSN